MPEAEETINQRAIEKARDELAAATGKLSLETEPALQYRLSPHPLAEDNPDGESS